MPLRLCREFSIPARILLHQLRSMFEVCIRLLQRSAGLQTAYSEEVFVEPEIGIGVATGLQCERRPDLSAIRPREFRPHHTDNFIVLFVELQLASDNALIGTKS